MTAFFIAIATFFSTFIGGLLGIKFRDKLHYVISFTAGVLLSVIFFDIVPEIFQSVQKNNFNIILPMAALVFGFLFIHILEKAAALHHSHEEEYADHRHPMVGLVSALGLAFHSFLDGVGIGLGFHIDYRVGLLIAIAVLAHDFSDGLNTVSLMLINKNSIRKALALLFVDAVAPVLGVLSTFLFVISDKFLILYLGFFAGFLLYIGAADLLPEAHSKNSSYKLIGLTTLGVVLIFFITRLV